jgi:uncharacterized protein YyaL (SSP411 family)
VLPNLVQSPLSATKFCTVAEAGIARRKARSTTTFLDLILFHDQEWITAQVEADGSWDHQKHVYLWTPELVATADLTLASVATKHVAVKQGSQTAASLCRRWKFSVPRRNQVSIEVEMVGGEDTEL